jgi:hypothetical protein
MSGCFIAVLFLGALLGGHKLDGQDRVNSKDGSIGRMKGSLDSDGTALFCVLGSGLLGLPRVGSSK